MLVKTTPFKNSQDQELFYLVNLDIYAPKTSILFQSYVSEVESEKSTN